MAVWNKLTQQSNDITALIVICQDYVLSDEEFMNTYQIQRNMNKPEFWIELADELYGNIENYIRKDEDPQEVDEDFAETTVSRGAIRDFFMNPTNRFELNDIICDTIESWLKHFG